MIYCATNMDHKEEANSSIGVQNVVAPEEENKTPDALLNDVILENIFKYLSFTDLKSCRDVKNIIWLRCSKKAWWSKTKVAIKFDHRGDSNLTEFLSEPEINSNAVNYKLLNFITGEYKGLWQNFGQSMKYLELNCCYFTSPDALQQLMYSQCPNLEKLVLKSITFLNKQAAKVVEPMKWKEPRFEEQKNLKFFSISFAPTSFGQISLMEVLSHFPNLKAFECCLNVDIYKIISIIREHDPNKLNLNHIDVRTRNVHVPEENVNQSEVMMYDEELVESARLVLLDPKLSFETLKLIVLSDQSEFLVDLLDAHAKTLKHFTLTQPWGGRIKLIPRQPLIMLEELKLFCQLSPVRILKCAPNVKVISLGLSATTSFVKNANPKLRVRSCKELEVTVGQKGHEMPDSGLAILVGAFRNVEKLEIDELSNSNFSMICKRWKKLVSLKVSFTDREVVNRMTFYISPEVQARCPGCFDGFLKSMETSILSERTAKVDFVLKELKKLPNLKKFKWKYFQIGDQRLWKKLSAKWPQDIDYVESYMED